MQARWRAKGGGFSLGEVFELVNRALSEPSSPVRNEPLEAAGERL